MKLPVLQPPPSPLPPLYARWAADMNLDLAPEPLATCDACVMLRPAADARPEGVYFDEATKCCTYQPALPNFLVGRILADRQAPADRGREVLLRRLAHREGVTPLGVEPSAVMRDLYLATTHAGTFGRTPELVCPHFAPGATHNCGIWRHRNATCATWHCKHARGATGWRAWRRLRELLALVEARLARWCAVEVGLGLEGLANLLALSDASGRPEERAPSTPERAYKQAWGPWAGREVDFFEACAERVGQLGWEDVVRVCGADAALGLALCRHAAAAVTTTLTSTLRAADFELGPADSHGAQAVSGYSPYDPLVLPAELVAALRAFDGRPTAEVLAELERGGLSLDDGLVSALVDFDLLLPEEPISP